MKVNDRMKSIRGYISTYIRIYKRKIGKNFPSQVISFRENRMRGGKKWNFSSMRDLNSPIQLHNAGRSAIS